MFTPLFVIEPTLLALISPSLTFSRPLFLLPSGGERGISSRNIARFRAEPKKNSYPLIHRTKQPCESSFEWPADRFSINRFRGSSGNEYFICIMRPEEGKLGEVLLCHDFLSDLFFQPELSPFPCRVWKRFNPRRLESLFGSPLHQDHHHPRKYSDNITVLFFYTSKMDASNGCTALYSSS